MKEKKQKKGVAYKVFFVTCISSFIQLISFTSLCYKKGDKILCDFNVTFKKLKYSKY